MNDMLTIDSLVSDAVDEENFAYARRLVYEEGQGVLSREDKDRLLNIIDEAENASRRS